MAGALKNSPRVGLRKASLEGVEGLQWGTACCPHGRRGSLLSAADATVYVGGLDEKVSEPLLWELFLQAGPVVNTHMPKDRVTGQHQGERSQSRLSRLAWAQCGASKGCWGWGGWIVAQRCPRLE